VIYPPRGRPLEIRRPHGGKISYGVKFLPANTPGRQAFIVRKYWAGRHLYRFKITVRFAL
jgi:hypothetical protein